MEAFIISVHHLRVSTLQAPLACDAFITVLLRITVWEMTKVTASLAHKEFCLSTGWKLSLFLWKLSHIHVTSRTTVSFKICSLVATLWDKYNFRFNIWSDYSLRGDYLWRGLSHSTVTGSCTCTGQETSFFFHYFYQNIPVHIVFLDGRVWKLIRRWSGYLTLFTAPLSQFF